MRLITELYERDLQLSERDGETVRNGGNFWLRRAARCVLFNAKQEVALLHMMRDDYYKLPGGGIEGGEQISEALKREVKEELGVNIEIGDALGLIIEYRDEHELMQFSYAYVARTNAEAAKPSEQKLTEEEQAEGLTVEWRPLSDAISMLERHAPQDYVSKFIQNRDLMFLKQLAT